jgi:hypothetical protein
VFVQLAEGMAAAKAKAARFEENPKLPAESDDEDKDVFTAVKERSPGTVQSGRGRGAGRAAGRGSLGARGGRGGAKCLTFTLTSA